jgi:5,10-methylenetetrahydromethanopterin reductase
MAAWQRIGKVRRVEYSISFPASLAAVEQARRAEALGFSAIGFFDSPALEADVWITIANAVQATRRIEVGTEVLVPQLRHPMAQAAAIATIEQLAPGRLYVGVGTGFTGRKAMGQRALSWASMARFLSEVRGLLAGEDVMIDGEVTRMLHPPGFAPARPVRVPFLVAANGPKGVAVALEFGDGLIFGGPPAAAPEGFAVLQLGLGGILLDPGEAATSPRALERAKMILALQYHLAYDGYHNPPLAVETLPGGAEWLAMIEEFPAETRHLHVHDRHMVELSAHDRAFVERYPGAVAEIAAAAAMTSDRLRETAQALAGRGATRISCGVAFADWERDMERYAAALSL